MEHKLKPCPFCGGDVSIFHEKSDISGETNPKRKTISKDVAWVTAGSDIILMQDMTDSHIANSMKLLGGRIGTNEEKLFDIKYLGFLCAERNKRKSKGQSK